MKSPPEHALLAIWQSRIVTGMVLAIPMPLLSALVSWLVGTPLQVAPFLLVATIALVASETANSLITFRQLQHAVAQNAPHRLWPLGLPMEFCVAYPASAALFMGLEAARTVTIAGALMTCFVIAVRRPRISGVSPKATRSPS